MKNVYAEENDSTGYTNVVLAYIESAATETTTYAYVTDDPIKNVADGKTSYTLTLSTGEFVTIDGLADAADLKKGDVISYTLNDDGQVRFCVTDTGKGIPAEQCHDIFNRFVKLDSFVQGAGLGLSICQSLVERMGGKIGVESCVGKGSCFWFTHPFTSATQSASTLVTENDMLATLQKKTVSRNYKPLILVAEDIDSNYLLIEALLKKDYRLVRAHNGSEVIELFNAETPDLILMDMKMPGISGIDTTTLLRKTGTQVPIVALTAFAYADDKSLAFDAGCNDFLTKPVSPPELRRVVSKWTVK